MQTHADKNHATPASADLKRQRGGESSVHLANNRAEAIAQRKLQDLANDSPQARRLQAAQDMANASMVQGPQPKPAQLESGPEEEELLQGRFQTLQRQSLEEEEPLQGKFDAIQRMGPEEEEELLQGKFAPIQRQGPEEEELQMKQGVRAESPAQLEADAAPRANNTGLPDNLKSGIESLSGMSLDNVKVHYDSAQPAQLDALAYAQGTDIHVAPGQEQHLPHEAWHVVQQAQGRVKPTMQMKEGVPVNDDAGLEHEADVMGAKAVQAKGRNARPDPAAATASTQLRKDKIINPSATKHFKDGWGALYGITDYTALKEKVPDNVKGNGSIPLGTYAAPPNDVMKHGANYKKDCTIEYQDKKEGNSPSTEIYHSGPSGKPIDWTWLPKK